MKYVKKQASGLVLLLKDCDVIKVVTIEAAAILEGVNT